MKSNICPLEMTSGEMLVRLRWYGLKWSQFCLERGDTRWYGGETCVDMKWYVMKSVDMRWYEVKGLSIWGGYRLNVCLLWRPEVFSGEYFGDLRRIQVTQDEVYVYLRWIKVTLYEIYVDLCDMVWFMGWPDMKYVWKWNIIWVHLRLAHTTLADVK